MKILSTSPKIKEKIYNTRFDENGILFEITTYFPLTSREKEIIICDDNFSGNSIEFKSIFSDEISDQQWADSKEQIIKRFQDELVDIK